MIAKSITYFDKSSILICDGRCNKAWGIFQRPRVQLSDNEDDYEYLADDELGNAPENPGTSEGGYMKPLLKPTRLNKWCARECERSSIVEPLEEFEIKDFSKRIKNIPQKEE